MPKISARGIEMPASPIRKLVPYAEAAKKRGKKVYHLNIGQPDIHTPETALSSIHNYKEKVIEYSHSAGNESYRKGLAKYYQQKGILVDHTNILITTGGSEALLFCMLATMDPGDEMIVPEPYYTNYQGFATEAGVIVKPITSYIETGFALPDINEFEKVITSRTRAIVICNPNNPTGYLYSMEELLKLKELALKHDLFIFSDEVYREFVYDGLQHISMLQIEGLEGHTILIDSVSKRYSMCGVRTGAIVTRNKEVYDTILKFGQARLSPPSLGQLAGEAALATPDEYFHEVYQEYIQRRDFIIDALNKIEGVFVPKPRGAFYSVVKLPVKNAEDFCRWLLEDFDYHGETVMLAPANGFYTTPGLGIDEARIAYVLKIDDLRKAVKCIEEALKIYPDRKK
jgi:aspartate aminotransferase